MVVKMMKWRPWPPILSRKFEVKVVVKKMEFGGCDPVHADTEKDYHRVVEIYVAWGLHLCGRTRLGYLSGTETPWVLVGDVSQTFPMSGMYPVEVSSPFPFIFRVLTLSNSITGH
ncbi:hypothetical protein HanRHA438_Chr15g0722571 [Helianthus annuus]|nr:hypothetical protein HanHA300_Chr15g0579181 [Helianthus annuus]KAJ0474360.1 hypothetical protein HanHA89_Chr15g0628821 [Helianthus annuus]KAJ0649924.1 hypothetical protein HanLR1_Chr15g0589811 [Helianthus annuus]KAJ0653712.1 hypothetical protein HanOQP8_Chr15g0586611 [Helianthus annuus]KAJ0846236.1 hypothetical protein HanRHA438_Chr15g0722571 [Helianthus annuus]